MPSSLINRNVIVDGHRTSVRLEPQMWDALGEITRHEGRTVHQICSEVDRTRRESTLTGALRVFILTYFREAASASSAGSDDAPRRKEGQAR
ncbi:MAG: ribbon-helix-helix domain-containing protein [Alphaproteobacteria bacterium]